MKGLQKQSNTLENHINTLVYSDKHAFKRGVYKWKTVPVYGCSNGCLQDEIGRFLPMETAKSFKM